jgi:hypothetical protein
MEGDFAVSQIGNMSTFSFRKNAKSVSIPEYLEGKKTSYRVPSPSNVSPIRSEYMRAT